MFIRTYENAVNKYNSYNDMIWCVRNWPRARRVFEHRVFRGDRYTLSGNSLRRDTKQKWRTRYGHVTKVRRAFKRFPCKETDGRKMYLNYSDQNTPTDGTYTYSNSRAWADEIILFHDRFEICKNPTISRCSSFANWNAEMADIKASNNTRIDMSCVFFHRSLNINNCA